MPRYLSIPAGEVIGRKQIWLYWFGNSPTRATGTLVLLDPPQRTENCSLPAHYFVVPALVRLYIYEYEYSFEF
jgi:hypothetical protein